MKRRIITIDDNLEIHRDFQSVLVPPRENRGLDEMEAAIFGTTGRSVQEEVEYQLDSALQGEEGVEKVCSAMEEGNPYALAFVDMRMPPGWDGVETVRHIWKVDPAVQVVICTAYSDYSSKELREHFRRTDSLLILKKPFAAEEVEHLASALTEKWILARQAAMKLDELEHLVRQRTKELAETNRRLVGEVAQRKASEEKLRMLSLVDGLTGVPNRRVFDDTLALRWSVAVRNEAPLSLLMIDLDFFKSYNDRYGHLAGDECLRRIATALFGSVSRGGDLVSRYGGEEFAVILPETDLDGATSVAHRLIADVESLGIPHDDSPVGPAVTISVGCASVVPSSGLDPRTLIAAADRALYHAKNTGRNRLACEDGH